MLVNELRKEIEKYDKNELQNIIVELYKRIPKDKKDGYNVDEFIKNSKKIQVLRKKYCLKNCKKKLSISYN